MEIKIDTEKDSKSTIRRVIGLLQSLIEESGESSTSFSSSNSSSSTSQSSSVMEAPSTGLFNMFGGDNASNSSSSAQTYPSSSTIPSSSPSSTGVSANDLLSQAAEEEYPEGEEDDDFPEKKPKIEFY